MSQAAVNSLKPLPMPLGKSLYRNRFLLAMAIPAIVWLIIFAYIPMVGIYVAFSDFKVTKPMFDAPFVGLKHFIALFNSETNDLFRILWNTIGMSLYKLAVGFPLPIVFAILLNEVRHDRFKRTIQTISYLPHFLSWVVLGGMMMGWLADIGIINDLLIGLGVIQSREFWLAKPEMFWTIVVVSDVWKGLGWGAIIYLAAISGIDQELYEAATIDGANRWHRIIHITVPSILGTIVIMFILAVSGILNSNFDQVLVMSNPLNFETSDVIDVFVYRTGIRAGRYSYAGAIGIFKSIIAVILLLGANKVSKKATGHGIF